MNILSGAKLINRSSSLAAAGALEATAIGIASAASVLSIRQAIEGKGLLKEKKALAAAAHEIRRLAIRIARNDKRNSVLLEEAKETLLQKIGESGRKLVVKGLATMGSWFIRTVLTGVTSIVVPAFRLLTYATGFVLRTVIMNPVALGILAAASAGYLLYRKFAKQADLPPHDIEVITPKDGKHRVEAASTGQRQGFTSAAVPAASTATPAPTVVLDRKGKVREKQPFGILNNNPGNIEYRGQPGATLYKPSPDKPGRFAIFPTQEEGLYQIGRQLQIYDSRGVNTIRKMINKYAPPSENSTAAYVDSVSRSAGYDADKALDMTDKDLVAVLIKAIVTKEVGHAPYTDSQYAEAASRSIAFRGNRYQDNAAAIQLPTYGRVSSEYGDRVDPVTGAFKRKHKGIDIAAPIGTPVYAATSGRAVVSKGTKGGYGNLLDILGTEYNTRYAHLDSFKVDDGDSVEQGQVVATVGNTGRSTGAHLHFEVRDKDGKDINPASLISIPKKIEKAHVVLPTTSELEVIRHQGKILRVDRG